MWIWIIFIICIIIFLALDLGVFHKNDHVIRSKEAGIWTAIWVTVALSFSGVIYWLFSENLVENPTDLTPGMAVLKYITGYLIELSLSIDNVFVIAVIFSSFAICFILLVVLGFLIFLMTKKQNKSKKNKK